MQPEKETNHKVYIAMSTRGQRPEAEKIFGADYDGDIAWVIANQACVPMTPTPEPRVYEASSQVERTDMHGLPQSVARFLETKWESICGLLDAELMRIAASAKGPGHMRSKLSNLLEQCVCS